MPSRDPRTEAEIQADELRARAGKALDSIGARVSRPKVTILPPNNDMMTLNGTGTCILQGHQFTVSPREYQQIIQILVKSLARSLREEAARVATVLTSAMPEPHGEVSPVRIPSPETPPEDPEMEGEIGTEELQALREGGHI